MRLRAYPIAFTMFLLLTLFANAWAFGSTVRGKLQRQGGRPAVNVKVTIRNSNAERLPAVYTDTGGLYYFYNVPAGKYEIEIWISGQPMVFTIGVSNDQYTDIAPITIP
jgi:hypothetical protein